VKGEISHVINSCQLWTGLLAWSEKVDQKQKVVHKNHQKARYRVCAEVFEMPLFSMEKHQNWSGLLSAVTPVNNKVYIWKRDTRVTMEWKRSL